MSAAGEGAAASAYEGGGVGGKFRKRPFRRSQTTPYERPPTALRNPSWLSKLVVDPASKLIAAGAQRFFSSVFRKRLPPPPPPPQPPEENHESMNGIQETVPDNHAGPREPADIVGGSSTCNNDTSGISELEQLLKQKSFTKSEIDRLTELLHSRAVDLPVKDDGIRSKANISIQNNFSKAMPDTGRHQEFPIPLEGNKTERVIAHGAVSTPTINKTLLEDEIAAPAELAKAYMGSRPLQVSPSTLSLRTQIAREDAVLLNSSPFTSKLPITSVAIKTTGHVGIPENGFTTPRSRGRSAIYNMARTPYSRVHPTPLQKVSGSRNYGYTGPSSLASQSAWDNSGQIASKASALKRRSSVLDDDIGSVGPIRRIRQKSNLSSHGTSHPSRGTSLGSDAAQLHKLPLMEKIENRVSNTPSTSYAHVPRESSEMAARIFEHLEKMTPKEKSSESKLAAARERSSFKLTPNMLRGQALSSLDDLDASKLLQNSQVDHKLGDQPISSLPNSRDSNSQKQGRVQENGPAKYVHPRDQLTPVVNTGTTVPVRDTRLRTEDAATPKFIPQSSERKRAFKMSAHEDSFELDDDVPSNEPASKSAEGRGMEKSMMNRKSIPTDDQALDKTPVLSEVRTHPVLVSSKRTEWGTSNAPMAGEEHTGSTFSLSHASAKSPQSASLSQSALAPHKPTTAGDSPLFLNFGSKTFGNVPFSTESKAESSSSLMNVSTGATDAKVSESDKSDTKSSQLLDGTVNGQSGIVASLASNSTSTISIFSAGAPSSNLVSNNGPLASNASTPSGSSAPVSSELTNENFTNSLSNTLFATGPTTISTTGSTTSTSAASNSGLFIANVAPSVSSAPIFNFGSSRDPSIAISAAPTIANAETTDLKINGEKENNFDKVKNSFFGSTSFAAASTGSSIFGLDSFVSSAAANNQLQGSVTATGSAVSTEPSPAGSGIPTVSQSMPVQFGSSSSPMVFGASGITSFTSSSIFGSSAPATKLSVSVATSAQSSSASTSETNLVNSSSAGTPSIFKFGVISAASSEANAISSSSTATPGTFTFGVSSAASSSSNSSVTPGFFGVGASSSSSSSATSSSSTTPGIYSFGASSSVSSSPANAITSSSVTAPSIFSFGTSNPACSSTEANSVSSSGANSSTFGSSWQASKSPTFGSTFNTSSPSTGFSFGASSSSFVTTNSSPVVFGSATGASSSPIFSFSATTTLPSSSTQSVFGNSTSPFAASPGNNDQMNTEDTMAEDTMQSSTPAAPVFGQSPVSPSPSGSMFGSTVPSPAVNFQFGSQQNQAAPQNLSQFQPSGSLEFNAGGSFSLGSGASDKSGRKIVKVNRNRNRKR